MQHILAFVQANQPTAGVDKIVAQLVAALIYGILAPAIYLVILYADLELAWPRGILLRQRMREFWERREAAERQATQGIVPSSWIRRPNQRLGRRSAASTLEADPTFQIRCTVGGLIALAVFSLVITNWVNGYLHGIPGPQLASSQASSGKAVFFILMLGIGVLGGFTWASEMRSARGSHMSLAIVAVSLSLVSTLFFFYLVESKLHDTLVVLALGIFSGELIVFARHPAFVEEGLFGELFLLAEAEEASVLDESAGAEYEEEWPDPADGTSAAEPAAEKPEAAEEREGPGEPTATPASVAATAQTTDEQSDPLAQRAAEPNVTHQFGPDPTTAKLASDQEHNTTA